MAVKGTFGVRFYRIAPRGKLQPDRVLITSRALARQRASRVKLSPPTRYSPRKAEIVKRGKRGEWVVIMAWEMREDGQWVATT